MKKIIFIIVSILFITSMGSPLLAKGGGRGGDKGFPGKGQGAIHSNAPSTGTQVKGKARAMEVGHGKKKGLYKEKKAHHHDHKQK